jgi:putative DNA primase/helicase
MIDPSDTKTSDLFDTPAPQTTAELWTSYAPAPSDHDALQRYNIPPSVARIIPVDASMPFEDDGTDWLVLPLHNAHGTLTSLVFLSPQHGKPPRFDTPTAKGGHVIGTPDKSQPLYLAHDPQTAFMIGHGGLACVWTVTPDTWSATDRPAAKHGGNLAYVAKDWIKAGYRVAIPTPCHQADTMREWMTGIAVTVLPIEGPLSIICDDDEVAAMLGALWREHGPVMDSDEEQNACVREGETTENAPTRIFDHGGGRFEVRDDGLFFVDQDKDGNEYDRLLSPAIHVLAKTRTPTGTAWGRLLEWRDDDHRLHQWAMPLDLLQGDVTDVCKELAYRGASPSLIKRNRDLFITYLQVCPTHRRALCVERLGWHGGAFILPHGAIGYSDDLTVYQNPHGLESAFIQSGTAEQWRDHVAALAIGNSRLMFALSLAFAAPLAELAGEQSGGFHFRGGSSSGKSTALDLACSVWGSPRYKREWRATTNGLEALAALHNDCLLALDELNQCEPKAIGQAVYMLANGQAKTRMNKTLSARASLTWRVLFLSAGEQGLSDLLAQAGQQIKAGQEIRLADIPADAGAGLGAFEQLQGTDDPSAFSVAIKDAAATHYGTVGMAWLNMVANDRPTLTSTIKTQIDHFTVQHVPAHASGQVQRVARRFALVAAAGELATEAGLTGWVQRAATQAAARCFADWLLGFGGIGNHEERAIIEQVQAFIEAHGSSRFESMTADRERIANRVGYMRQKANEAREYLVFPTTFRKEVCKGFDYRQVQKILAQHGKLKHNHESGYTTPCKTPDNPKDVRMYVLVHMNADIEQDPINTTRSDRSTRSGLENTSVTTATGAKTKPVATVAEPVAQSSATVATVYQNATRSCMNPSKHKAATVTTAATGMKTTTLQQTANGYPLNAGFAPPKPTDGILGNGELDL